MDGRSAWLRRARPALGTLIEVGVPAGASAQAAVQAAFDAILGTEARLSRFIATSELSRFNAAAAGEAVPVDPQTAGLLRFARKLNRASNGLFDISLGSAPHGWQLHGAMLHKTAAATRLDLGGIGKGQAVDAAIDALRAAGAAAGWVNAGGDARAFGELDLPIHVRDEAGGGAWPFALLRDGAIATSHYGRGTRSVLAGAEHRTAHVSVAAPLCLWADALTKIVAASGDVDHPLLAAYGARAWSHADGPTPTSRAPVGQSLQAAEAAGP